MVTAFARSHDHKSVRSPHYSDSNICQDMAKRTKERYLRAHHSNKEDDKSIRGLEDATLLSPNGGCRDVESISSPRGREPERGTTRYVANMAMFESPTMRPLSRRPTIESRRTTSPPNSVKAFANARRRGQDVEAHDPRASSRRPQAEVETSNDYGLRVSQNYPNSISRSFHSRKALDRGAHETSSPVPKPKSSPEAEDTKLDNVQKDGLHIDFDYLETLIDAESRDQFGSSDFVNLPDSSIPTATRMFTSDGDFIDVASQAASIAGEKEATAPQQPLPRASQHIEQSRFNYFSSALESTIHAAEFGDLVLPGESIRSLFEMPEAEADGVWWLNMNNPTGSEVWTICKAFGIHPLTIEDIIHQESREKIELFPLYYFACFRSFIVVEEDNEKDYHPFNVYAVVFREGILSFSFTANSHASRVRFRISQLKEQVSLSSDWICYALIDDIVDSFGPAINEIEREADAIEDQVFITRVDDNQAFLRKIGYTRKNVMSLMRLLGGKADVLRAFTKRCTEDFDVTPHMDIALYLGDIQDHAVTMMHSLVHFDTMLSRSHSNYLAQLSIDNIDMGNRTNDFLSRVTVIATVIVPLNVVCGLFGMNVKVPWKDTDNLNAFFGILGSITAFALLSLLVARRFKYL
ncbi:CorA-like Mg2+ transporter [Colletotrichum tamarilloi]|uniref:CorA-like Mg2+ transporter n=1 Tax=Colletotrichum tamarilloi TaxID=1209934 RepID=A0ABQ9RMN8_9PEZI|nr:CorA-like Mg2+ transporter [Colletotrichum tamarilloi]KAK1507481.1 CorA-like Mg2+ transporter [Colletotrichum tamarilloi]